MRSYGLNGIDMNDSLAISPEKYIWIEDFFNIFQCGKVINMFIAVKRIDIIQIVFEENGNILSFNWRPLVI